MSGQFSELFSFNNEDLFPSESRGLSTNNAATTTTPTAGSTGGSGGGAGEVFVLDAGVVFVWAGHNHNETVKKLAIETALDYATLLSSPTAPQSSNTDGSNSNEGAKAE